MPTNEEVVQAHIDAYNARDLNKFADCYAQDIETRDGQGNQMVKGHENLRQLYGKLFEQSPKLHVDIKNRIVAGQFVIDEVMISGINLEGFPNEMHGAEVNRITNGKIDRVQLLL